MNPDRVRQGCTDLAIADQPWLGKGRAMKAEQSIRIAAFSALILATALFTSGCIATNALWEKKAYRPAEDPRLNLALSTNAQDVLVQYDERRGKSKNIERRAYWLFTCYTNAPPPAFVALDTATGLEAIPLFVPDAITNAPPQCGWYAVPVSDQPQFELFRDRRGLGSFTLPEYQVGPRSTAWRVALTPVAMVGDVLLDAVIVGVIVEGRMR